MSRRIVCSLPALALPFLCLLVCGCGGEKLVKVSGTVTRHGKPLPGVGITFTPEKGLRSFARSEPDGHFTMIYTTGQEGVVVGTHKVTVQLLTAGAKEDKEQQKRLAQQQKDADLAQMLRKYGNVATTPLTVEARADQEIPLSLD